MFYKYRPNLSEWYGSPKGDDTETNGDVSVYLSIDYKDTCHNSMR